MLLYFGYMAALVGYLILRVAIAGGFGVAETSWLDNPLADATTSVRIATAAIVAAKGVGLLLVPRFLSPDYSFDAIPLVTTLRDPRLLGPLALLALLPLLAWRSRGPFRRGLGWATAAYAIALFPVSNLALSTGTIFGERLLYLPSVVFCLVAGGVSAALLRTRSARWAGPGLAAILVLLGVQAARYSRAWTDDIALFTWAVDTQPNSTKAHHKLGEELLRAGRIGEAFPALERALAIAPDNVYAQETLDTALRLAAADTVEGPALLRGFIDSAGSRYPTETAWAEEMLRRLEKRP
jgi:tetratricopeptide (TPR) repeat protein